MPAIELRMVRIIHLSGKAFTGGIEAHHIEGINTTQPSVADCFNFRNKISTDLSLEALRDYRRNYCSGMNEQWQVAYARRPRDISPAAY